MPSEPGILSGGPDYVTKEPVEVDILPDRFLVDQSCRHESLEDGFDPEDVLQASELGKKLGVDWTGSKFSPIDLAQGISVEMEHRDVTGGDPETTAKIALAHLREDPRYYTKLAGIEAPEKRDVKERQAVDAAVARVAAGESAAQVLRQLVEGVHARTPKSIQYAAASGKGVTGPNGSRAIGFEWISRLGEKMKHGEMVSARVSDFERAIPCTACHRPVVYVFWVQDPAADEIAPYGSECVYLALGHRSKLSQSGLASLQSRILDVTAQDREDAEARKNYEAWIAKLAVSMSDPGALGAATRRFLDAVPAASRSSLLVPRYLVHLQSRLVMRADHLAVDRLKQLVPGWVEESPENIRRRWLPVQEP